MKKVASVLSVVIMAIGLYTSQGEETLTIDFDMDTMLACGNCDYEGSRDTDDDDDDDDDNDNA